MEKYFRTFHLQDEPDLILNIVSAVSNKNMSITDLCYAIYDTDAGKAICTIGVERTTSSVEKAMTEIPEPKPLGPVPDYPTWFRLPCVDLFVVGCDRIGFLRDLLSELNYALGREGDNAKGNIVSLRAFQLTGLNRFVVSVSVATKTKQAQERMITKFSEWCETTSITDFQVAYRNQLSDLLEDISRGVA